MMQNNAFVDQLQAIPIKYLPKNIDKLLLGGVTNGVLQRYFSFPFKTYFFQYLQSYINKID